MCDHASSKRAAHALQWMRCIAERWIPRLISDPVQWPPVLSPTNCFGILFLPEVAGFWIPGFPDFVAHASDLPGHRHPHWLCARKEPDISTSCERCGAFCTVCLATSECAEAGHSVAAGSAADQALPCLVRYAPPPEEGLQSQSRNMVSLHSVSSPRVKRSICWVRRRECTRNSSPNTQRRHQDPVRLLDPIGRPHHPCRIAHSRTERCKPTTCQTQGPPGCRCRQAHPSPRRRGGARRLGRR